MDLDLALVVGGRREHAAPPAGHRGAALDHLHERPAARLDAERERRHVEQDDLLDVAAQDAGLDRRAERHDLVRVDLAVRLAAEDLAHHPLHQRRAGLPADEQHVGDVAGADAGHPQRVEARLAAPLDEVADEPFELVPRERAHEVGRALRRRGEERQLDLADLLARELALRLLGRLLEALQGQTVPARIDAGLLREGVGHPGDDPLVEVLAAEERVAGGREDLVDPFREAEDRDVERAAAEVVDGDDPVPGPAADAVGEARRRRLVEDPQDVEPGDPPRVARRLPLAVVEVGRDGDHGVFDLLAEVLLRRFPQVLQDRRGNLLRAEHAVAELHRGVAVRRADDVVRREPRRLIDFLIGPLAPDQPLDRVERPFGVGRGLPLGERTDEPLAAAGEGDDRGHGVASLARRDDDRVIPLHHGDDRVRRPQVDPHDSTHRPFLAGPAGRSSTETRTNAGLTNSPPSM